MTTTGSGEKVSEKRNNRSMHSYHYNSTNFEVGTRNTFKKGKAWTLVKFIHIRAVCLPCDKCNLKISSNGGLTEEIITKSIQKLEDIPISQYFRGSSKSTGK